MVNSLLTFRNDEMLVLMVNNLFPNLVLMVNNLFPNHCFCHSLVRKKRLALGPCDSWIHSSLHRSQDRRYTPSNVDSPFPAI